MFLDKIKKHYVIATPIDFDRIDQIAAGLQSAKFDVDWSNAGVELLFADLVTVSININKDMPNRVKLDVRYLLGKNRRLNIDEYIKFSEDLNQVSFTDDKDLVKNIVTEVNKTFERYFS